MRIAPSNRGLGNQWAISGQFDLATPGYCRPFLPAAIASKTLPAVMSGEATVKDFLIVRPGGGHEDELRCLEEHLTRSGEELSQ